MSKRNTKERGASTKVNKPQMKSFEVPKPSERNPMERKSSKSHVTRRLPEKKEKTYTKSTQVMLAQQCPKLKTRLGSSE